MALAGTEVSDAMLLRTCSVIRASLWTRRCWESGLETSDVRADLVTGELVERRDCLFPVCRSFRLAGRGASMIIASIVDASTHRNIVGTPLQRGATLSPHEIVQGKGLPCGFGHL